MASISIHLDLALDPARRNAYPARMLKDAIDAVVKGKRVVCMNGAGISTSAGIPDFRSKEGLYRLASASGSSSSSPYNSQPPSSASSPSYAPSSSPQGPPPSSSLASSSSSSSSTIKGADIFSSDIFSSSQGSSQFFTFMSNLHSLSEQAAPTPTHEFLRLLDRKGKMVRCYTQNIDGLEARAGLVEVEVVRGGTTGSSGRGAKKRKINFDDQEYGSSRTWSSQASKGKKASSSSSSSPSPSSSSSTAKISKAVGPLVHLHGKLSAIRCSVCSYSTTFSRDIQDAFSQGRAVPCEACRENLEVRKIAGKRISKGGGNLGFLRPDITLYGEPGKDENEIADIAELDLTKGKPDCLLVFGSSLKVHGFKILVKDFARQVQDRGGKAIFINLTPPSKEWLGIFDLHVQGTTDGFANKVTEEWKSRRPQDFQTQTLVSDSMVSGKTMQVKAASKAGPAKAKTPKNSDDDAELQKDPPQIPAKPKAAITKPTPTVAQTPGKKKTPPTPASTFTRDTIGTRSVQRVAIVQGKKGSDERSIPASTPKRAREESSSRSTTCTPSMDFASDSEDETSEEDENVQTPASAKGRRLSSDPPSRSSRATSVISDTSVEEAEDDEDDHDDEDSVTVVAKSVYRSQRGLKQTKSNRNANIITSLHFPPPSSQALALLPLLHRKYRYNGAAMSSSPSSSSSHADLSGEVKHISASSPTRRKTGQGQGRGSNVVEIPETPSRQSREKQRSFGPPSSSSSSPPHLPDSPSRPSTNARDSSRLLSLRERFLNTNTPDCDTASSSRRTSPPRNVL